MKGQRVSHPFLRITDVAETLLRGPNSHRLLAGHPLSDVQDWTAAFGLFWHMFKDIQPSHCIFEHHAEELSFCVPCLLHGDEGTGHRKRPLMQLCWGPLHGVGLGSMKRLFLITAVPHKAYRMHNRGTDAGNPVLDAIFEGAARSFMQAFYQGVEIPHGELAGKRLYLVCLGLAGDHPFQTKAMKCSRNHVSSLICPLCLAETGSNCPYEDVSRHAAWVRTIGLSKPYKRPPPLRFIPGFEDHRFIRMDLFHVGPHGVGRTFAASCICMLAGPLEHFEPELFAGQKKKDAALSEAYLSFASFCKCLRQSPQMKDFSPENLNWQQYRNFPESSMKGSDCTLVIRWLIDYFSSTPVELDYPCRLAFAAAAAFDNLMRLAYTESRLMLGREEAARALKYSETFLRAYKKLAGYWGEKDWCLFNITPKVHYMAHFSAELVQFLDSPGLSYAWNPGAFSTPMMEDFTGIISRVSRTSHPSTVARSTIMKYLVSARQALR